MSTSAHALTPSRATLLIVDEIRAQMARRRMSQVALAKRLGVPQPWLNRRLMGHTPISLDDLERIAEALDVTFTDLVLSADRNAISLRHGDDKTGWFHRHRAVAISAAGWLPRRMRHTREAEMAAHRELMQPPALGPGIPMARESAENLRRERAAAAGVTPLRGARSA